MNEARHPRCAVRRRVARRRRRPRCAAGRRSASPRPPSRATDTSGKPVSLADFKGKYVVLEWVNPGCPFVQKHYDSGNMPATQKDATGQGRGLAGGQLDRDRTPSDYKAPAELQPGAEPRAPRRPPR